MLQLETCNEFIKSCLYNQQLRLTNADMAASAAVANVLLLKKRADDRQRAALRIKFEVFHFCLWSTHHICV